MICTGRVPLLLILTPSFSPGLRADDIAGHKLLETIDDDAVAWLHTIENEPMVFDRTTETDRNNAGVVIVANEKHFTAAGVIAANGLLRHRKRVRVDALHDLNAHIHARQQR